MSSSWEQRGSDSCCSQRTKGCPCAGQWGMVSRASRVCSVQFREQRERWERVRERRPRCELCCPPAGDLPGPGDTQLLPSPAQLWQHSLAELGLEPGRPCVPQSPGAVRGVPVTLLPAQNHLLSPGSAALTPDNAFAMWSVSKWGQDRTTQACAVFLWDSLGLRRDHLKVQQFRITSNKELLSSRISVVCSAPGCSVDIWERQSAASASENVAQALALVTTSRPLWIIRVFFCLIF